MIIPNSLTISSIKTFIVYALAGALAVAVEVVLIYFMVQTLNWWYVIASALAYFIGFFIGFFLRKLLAFHEHGWSHLLKQMSLYGAILLLILTLNTLAVVILVENLSLAAWWAQVISAGPVGLVGYLLNKKYTFKKT